MPADINDLSRILGRLEADASAAKNQRTEIFKQLEEVKSKLSCLPQLAKTVESHSIVIDDYKRLKQRGIGIALALTTIGGAIGSAGMWMAKNFLSKS
jgi:hypothetical protein